MFIEFNYISCIVFIVNTTIYIMFTIYIFTLYNLYCKYFIYCNLYLLYYFYHTNIVLVLRFIAYIIDTLKYS